MNRVLSDEVVKAMEEAAARKTARQTERANQFMIAIDNYFTTRVEYERAAQQCEANHGVVIYDVVAQEKDAWDLASDALRHVVIDLQNG